MFFNFFFFIFILRRCCTVFTVLVAQQCMNTLQERNRLCWWYQSTMKFYIMFIKFTTLDKIILVSLTLPVPCISENCIKIKINLMVQSFIKLFEAPQRSVKIKIKVNFFSSPRIGKGRLMLTIEIVFTVLDFKR